MKRKEKKKSSSARACPHAHKYAEPVILRSKPGKLLVPVLCSGMAMAFFLLMAFSGETLPELHPFIQGISLFGAAIVFLFFICFLRRLLRPRPVLLITKDGITDASTPSSIGFVSWENTGRIRLFSLHGERFIGVDVRNIRERLKKEPLPGVKKNAVRSRLALGQPAMLISLAATGEKPEEILEVLEDYQKRFTPKPPQIQNSEAHQPEPVPCEKVG